MVLNLFVPWPISRTTNLVGPVYCSSQSFPCAVAHFNCVTFFVALFDYVGDVIMTKILGSALELMAAEVVQKKVIASPVPRMVNPRVESELICKGK